MSVHARSHNESRPARVLCREAQAKFEHAIELLGASAPLLYSIALCNYKLNKPGEALKYLARVVEMV